jgi:serine/threonine-protein kinase
LAAGARLGPYEITAPIGAGGMGVVYRARDPRVGRDVAVKVSSDHFSDRFEREARAVAALNHPNICTLYDVGPDYLVMELIDGQPPKGPLPLPTALDYARQIALALDAAHQQGIVHRDLKPANIRVRDDGTVKVLDFGLAKIGTEATSAVDPSNSPTMAATGTQAGVILGTAAYMAPEQARGRPVDKRADIWAFGVVFYEMLTGRRPFDGADVASILAAVLQSEPRWDDVPDRVRRLIHSCLEKDPQKRLRDIGDVWRLLDDPKVSAPRSRPGYFVAVAALFAVVAAIALWAPWRAAPPAAAAPIIRLDVDLGPDIALLPLGAPTFSSVIISPDGRRLVFVGTMAGGPPRLFARRLDEPAVTELAGTQGAMAPVFSPDGQWVAFWNGSRVVKVPIDGGTAVPLAALDAMTGGTWSEEEGLIVGTGVPGAAGLVRVPADGGPPTTIVKLEEGEMYHTFPQLVPGRKLVLMALVQSPPTIETTTIDAVSLETGRRKTVLRGATSPRYLSSGHLLYAGPGGVSVAPFDLDALEVRGSPVRVLEDALLDPVTVGVQLDLARDGTLVYRTSAGGAYQTPMRVDWIDNTGQRQPLLDRPGLYGWGPRLSPDGRRIALNIRDGGNQDLWVYDLQRGTMTRLTHGGATHSDPIWTPDGRFIVAAAVGAGLIWMRADGSGQPQPMFEIKDSSVQFPSSFTRDGRRLAFHQIAESPAFPQLWSVEIEEAQGRLKPGTPVQFLASRAQDAGAVFSPDGRWIAYHSNKSGRFEAYVRPFPGSPSGGGEAQISNNGGSWAAWSPNGRDLLYRTGDVIMAVGYRTTGDTFQADKPRVWAADLSGSTGFDIAPDGKRVAVVVPASAAHAGQANRIVFVQNFVDSLRARAPQDR